MAKTTREERAAKRKQRFLVAMMLIVAASMLFSGIAYINIGGGRAPVQDDVTGKLAMIEQYQLAPLTNGSILAEVGELKDDLIAIPDAQCMLLDNIVEIRNATIDGVDGISCEVANPEAAQGYSVICGSYIMFKFRLTGNQSSAIDGIRNRLDGILSEYNLMRGYVVKLPTNVLGSADLYVIGGEDREVGDYVRVFLFSKDLIAGGTGLFGLERGFVPKGPHFHATVVNVTGISVGGSVPGEFNRQAITDTLELNESEFNSKPPEFRVNGTLSEEGLEMIEADIQEVDGKTTISFNSSGEEIEEILEDEDLPYSFEPGAVFFQVPLNSSTEDISSLLEENGVENVTFQRIGLVSMPREVIVSDRLVPIENYEAFGATLYMDTEVGDKINISLNTFTFGEQIIPFGASEFRNESSQ